MKDMTNLGLNLNGEYQLYFCFSWQLKLCEMRLRILGNEQVSQFPRTFRVLVKFLQEYKEKWYAVVITKLTSIQDVYVSAFGGTSSSL